MSHVRHFAQYLYETGHQVYSYRDFCGTCGYELVNPYGRKQTAEHIGPKLNGVRSRLWDAEDDGSAHWSFCPWCGVELAEEWWKDQLHENARVIDHFHDPGHHPGDTHEFRGENPECAAGHWLSSTSEQLCWCNPTVEPSITGCLIIHNDVPNPRAEADHG